jgi:hypothetical protein
MMNTIQPVTQGGAAESLPPILPNGAYSRPTPPVTDDWTFLKDFGDSSDLFYVCDAELRDLLDGRYVLDGPAGLT